MAKPGGIGSGHFSADTASVVPCFMGSSHVAISELSQDLGMLHASTAHQTGIRLECTGKYGLDTRARKQFCQNAGFSKEGPAF